MSLPARVATLMVAFLAVVGGAVFIVIHYLLAGPPVEDFTAGVTPEHGRAGQHRDAGGPAEHRQHQAGLGLLLHQEPEDRRLGAHHPVQGAGRYQGEHDDPRVRRLHAAAQSASGARSPAPSAASSHVERASRPRSINSWSGCNVGHTFSIPGINLNVPMASPALTATLCGTSPCTSGPHSVVTFSFLTPRTAGSLLLAVPGSLRRRLPRRIWRSHADDRVHDRQHAGGGLMAAPSSGRRRMPPDSGRAKPWPADLPDLAAAGPGRRPAHLVRLGPHLPPGAMSSAASASSSPSG